MMSKPVSTRGNSQLQSKSGLQAPQGFKSPQSKIGPQGPQGPQGFKSPQSPYKAPPMSMAPRGASQSQNKARGTASSAVRKMIP